MNKNKKRFFNNSISSLVITGILLMPFSYLSFIPKANAQSNVGYNTLGGYGIQGGSILGLQSYMQSLAPAIANLPLCKKSIGNGIKNLFNGISITGSESGGDPTAINYTSSDLAINNQKIENPNFWEKIKSFIGIPTVYAQQADGGGNYFNDPGSNSNSFGLPDFSANSASSPENDFSGLVDVNAAAGIQMMAPIVNNPTQDVTEKAIERNTSATAKSTATSTANDTCLKSIGRLIVKLMIQKMTLSTVDWINHGFNGGPAFVQDPDKFFGDLAKNEILQFGIDIKNPTLYPYGKAFIQNTANYVNNSFENNAKYSLDKMIRDTTPQYSDVMFRKDFSKGGWNAWDALTQTPANNALGFNLLASNELNNRINNKIQSTTNQLIQSSGFLGDQRCSVNTSLTLQDRTNALKAKKQDPCIDQGGRWIYVTPGQLVANAAIGVQNYPKDSLIQAQDLNDALASITDALLNQFNAKVLQKGFTALGDLYGTEGQFYNSNLSFNTNVDNDYSEGQIAASSWLQQNPNFNIRTDLTQALIDIQTTYLQKLNDQNTALMNTSSSNPSSVESCIYGGTPPNNCNSIPPLACSYGGTPPNCNNESLTTTQCVFSGTPGNCNAYSGDLGKCNSSVGADFPTCSTAGKTCYYGYLTNDSCKPNPTPIEITVCKFGGTFPDACNPDPNPLPLEYCVAGGTPPDNCNQQSSADLGFCTYSGTYPDSCNPDPSVTSPAASILDTETCTYGGLPPPLGTCNSGVPPTITCNFGGTYPNCKPTPGNPAYITCKFGGNYPLCNKDNTTLASLIKCIYNPNNAAYPNCPSAPYTGATNNTGLIPNIWQLDYCIPGPNPDFATISQNAMENILNGKAPDLRSSTLGKINNALNNTAGGQLAQQAGNIASTLTLGIPVVPIITGILGAFASADAAQKIKQGIADYIGGLLGVWVNDWVKHGLQSDITDMPGAKNFLEATFDSYKNLVNKIYFTPSDESDKFMPTVTAEARSEYEKIPGYQQMIINNGTTATAVKTVIQQLKNLKEKIDTLNEQLKLGTILGVDGTIAKDQQGEYNNDLIPIKNSFARLSASLYSGDDIASVDSLNKQIADETAYVHDDLLMGPYGCEKSLEKLWIAQNKLGHGANSNNIYDVYVRRQPYPFPIDHLYQSITTNPNNPNPLIAEVYNTKDPYLPANYIPWSQQAIDSVNRFKEGFLYGVQYYNVSVGAVGNGIGHNGCAESDYLASISNDQAVSLSVLKTPPLNGFYGTNVPGGQCGLAGECYQNPATGMYHPANTCGSVTRGLEKNFMVY